MKLLKLLLDKILEKIFPQTENFTPIKRNVSTAIKDDVSIKTYKVAGISYRLENVMKLAFENPEYDYIKKELIENNLIERRIYQHDFNPRKTELIPEPDNPHDPNAIKVVVDNVHIGYIKAESCSHVLKLLHENRIKKIDCEIGGGKYKYLNYCEDDEYKEVYELEKSTIEFYAHLKITESK